MTFQKAAKLATTPFLKTSQDWERIYLIITNRVGIPLKVVWKVNKRKYPRQVKAVRFLLRKRTREKFLAWVRLH